MRSVLIIDDDSSILKNMSYALATKKITTHTALTAKEGVASAKKEQPDVIFLDYKLPDKDGLTLIPQLTEKSPKSIIVMITGSATLDVAVKAMKIGAYDFIEKPFDINKIFAVLNKVEKEKENQDNIALLEDQIKKTQDNFIGTSKTIEHIKDIVKKVARVPQFTILITGESGTGKEVLIRYIHEHSVYANKPLVAVNCSAIPDTLLESELFGHEKGSFTGAHETKRGLFELANNGIIFLDEIGDMKLDLQTKLLRVLENRELRRIGGEETIPLTISIIAATNKDLAALIQENKFREDLYYRLNIIPINIPPLRERKEDIEPLLTYFIDKLNKNFRKKIKGLSDEARSLLLNYSYPGNIRELRNILERAMLLETSNQLTVENLLYLSAKSPASTTADQTDAVEYNYKEYQNQVLTKIEKSYFEKLLKKYNGNLTKAAEHAGIMVPSLSRILKRLGIKSKEFK